MASLYVPPGHTQAGVLGTGQRRWRERPKSDFEVLIENIKDTPMYQVIREDLAPYENWGYEREIHRRGEIDKRIPLNKEGVTVFLFDKPKNEENFIKILRSYQSYYGLSYGEMRDKRYKFKKNYESNMINLGNNDKLSTILNSRINGFEGCIQENYYLPHNYGGSIYGEAEILEYMRKQGNKEKKIRDTFKEFENYIMRMDMDEKLKIDFLKRLKRDKISMLADSILFGPNNYEFNSNLSKCISKISGIAYSKFRILINKYVLPQQKKVLLLGRTIDVNQYKLCSTLFHVNAAIWLIKNKPICHKYILWTLYLNRMYLVMSITKKMDIPIMIYVPESRIVKKTSYKKTKEEIKDKTKFIGIIQIPIYSDSKNKIIKYKYIFLFESTQDGSEISIINYYDPDLVTHYLAYDSDLNRLAIGTDRLRTTITYDELDGLYYMATQYPSEYRAYFYRDPFIQNMIFVSLKSNLIDKSIYPNYNLERVYMNKWYEDGFIKQFIFYTDRTKVKIEGTIQENKILYEQTKRHIRLSRNTHFINEQKVPEYIFISSNK